MDFLSLQVGKICFFDDLETEISSATTANQLLAIPYLDTGAGSNPREFQGMTPVNVEILRSMIFNLRVFWAKHSQVILTIKGGGYKFYGGIENGLRTGEIHYEDACLTNGLQTVSLMRILIIIKIYQMLRAKDGLYKKVNEGMKLNVNDSLKEYFANQPEIANFLIENIKLEHINKVLYWLHKEENDFHRGLFERITLEDLMNLRVSFKAVFLDSVAESYLETLEELGFEEGKNSGSIVEFIRNFGYEIATTNNTNQLVKEDDKFGTVHGEWINDNIMMQISGSIVDIEYRKNSISKNKERKTIHILEILRSIIGTSLIIENDEEESPNNIAAQVSRFANKREPIFKLFRHLINSVKNGDEKKPQDLVYILRQLMKPLIERCLKFETEMNRFYKDKLTFEYVSENLQLDKAGMEDLKRRFHISTDENNQEILSKLIRRNLSFSTSAVLPIFLYATRASLNIDERLNVSYELSDREFSIMLVEVYNILLKNRIQKQYGSTSDLFRDPELYIEAEKVFMILTQRRYRDSTKMYRVNVAFLNKNTGLLRSS
jgi:hypothetical protein